MLDVKTSIFLFIGYAIFILLLVWFTKKDKENSEDFLVMKRGLGVFQGSLSMAVSWIWAPAVFICSLQAFNQGLPGIFWFTAPNILTFFVFVPFALRLRKLFPNGYTISQAFKDRFKESYAHKASMIVTFGYQLGAIIINCVAGATLISLMSGIPYYVGVIMMGGVALLYSLISGLRASVMSDVAQMLLVLVVAFILVPLSLNEIGGFEVLKEGLGGVSGDFSSIFNAEVAFGFGIATTIGLIAGPVADQMFSQRAFAAKKGSIKKIFIYAGLIFGIVPIILSMLGFIGAAGVRTGLFTIVDPQMVGPETIGHLLPSWAMGLFALMAFAGLTSTLDSAFTAIGSLTVTDLVRFKTKDNKENNSSNGKIKVARIGMIVFAIVGMSIALLQPKLLWVFLVYGALAAALFLPAFLMLFWKRVTAKGVAANIISALSRAAMPGMREEPGWM